MDRQSFQAYKKRILSLIRLLGEKDNLRIPEIETNENESNSVIPFKKTK